MTSSKVGTHAGRIFLDITPPIGNYIAREENKGRENYIDNNNKENYASYASLFNYSMQTIKRLPSHASGLKVISTNFQFHQPQHQLHSQDLLHFHFSRMH